MRPKELRKNKLFNLIICFSFLILPSACEKKSPYSSSESQYLRLNLQDGDLHTLNPQMTVSLTGRSLLSCLFEGLTRADTHGLLQPAAASQIDISSDERVYTFTLRPHLWSNQQPVTAYHFESAWKKALHPDSKCLRSEFFYVIKNAELAKKGKISLDEIGIKAVDEKTLRVELEHPAPYFLDLCASIFYFPLYNNEDEPTVFNGPFILSNWEKEKRLQFIANPNYWDKEHVHLQGLDISIVKDGATALAMYEKRELDMVGDPFSSLPIEYMILNKNKGILKSKEVARIHGLFCNTEVPILKSANFRKALSLCIDRKAITEFVFPNQIPSVSPLPNCLSLLSNEEKVSAENCDKARELLQIALSEYGETLETLSPLTLAYVQTGREKALAEALQQQWEKELGIKVELTCSELAAHLSNLKSRNFQLGTLYRSSVYNDPMFFLEIHRAKQQTANYSSWENSNYTLLLDLIKETKDPLIRKERLKEAELQLINETPLIPLFSHNYQYILNENVKNLYISHLGYVDFKETYIEKS